MRSRAGFKNLKTAVLPATLAVLALLRPAEAAELRFTFIGNMAFHITDGSTTLLTDFPYESGAFGYMKWTAKQVGLSPARGHRIWKKYGLQPHRVTTFRFSTDPEFDQKLADVVGLYLNPP